MLQTLSSFGKKGGNAAAPQEAPALVQSTLAKAHGTSLVGKQAENHFSALLKSANPNQKLYILAQAGSAPEMIEGREDALLTQYKSFVQDLRRDPHIRQGTIPSGRDALGLEADENILKADGQGFTRTFLDACLIAVLRNEAIAPPNMESESADALEAKGRQPSPLGQQDMDWLERNYDHMANEPKSKLD